MSKRIGGMRIRRVGEQLYLDTRVIHGDFTEDKQESKEMDRSQEYTFTSVGVPLHAAQDTTKTDTIPTPTHNDTGNASPNGTTKRTRHNMPVEPGPARMEIQYGIEPPSPPKGEGSVRWQELREALSKLTLKYGQQYSGWVMFAFEDKRTARSAQSYVSSIAAGLDSKKNGWKYQTTIPLSAPNKLWVRMIRIDSQ